MPSDTRLILASSSPRRAELLRNAAIPFEVEPANVPEDRLEGEAALPYAIRVAREKAAAVASRRPGRFVLGADTVVIADEHVLGKPSDADDAIRMLRLLSARAHQVTTAVALLGPHGEQVASETTEVTFCRLSEEEIRAYVATGEPLDKAGAYAIQGIASRWICRLAGDYFNVMGLPVPLVYRMLRQHGAV